MERVRVDVGLGGGVVKPESGDDDGGTFLSIVFFFYLLRVTWNVIDEPRKREQSNLCGCDF